MYKIIQKARPSSILQFAPRIPGASIFILQLLLFSCSCSKSTTDPPPPPPPSGADTTSHNFTWTIDTIGTNWSILLDVAIINENDIWAVGEIHTAETDTFDSLGNWVPPYNAVRWNGQEWGLKRIPTNSVVGLGYSPMNAVFAFDSNNIWMFSNAGSYCHWNGSQWTSEYVPERQGGINKIWGSSPTDIYFVGTNGNITHYNGNTWQKLDSGTEVDIQDIWGAMNPQSGEYEILAVASFSIGVPQAKKLLRIDGTTVSAVQDSGLPLALETVWFAPGKEYFIGGPGIFHTSDISKAWEPDTRQPLFYMNSIRGLDVNDIIMAGSDGYISHYNGSTSRLYTGAELPEFFGNYYSVAVHPNVIAAVGSYGGRQGIVAVGKRSTQ